MKTRFLQSLTLITLLSISINTAASLRVEDVARQFFPEDYDTLMVGEQSVPVLYSESTLPLARGVIVILVNEGSQILNLAAATELSRLMNNKGWHTLISPSLPVGRQPASMSQDNAPAASDDTASDSMSQLHPMQNLLTPTVDFDASKTQLTLLMGAIANHISQHKGFRIVVASGMTSTQLLAAANDGDIAPPDSLVTLLPYWPDRKLNKQVPQLIAQSGFPVLDISLPGVNPWEAQTSAARADAAKTALKLQYRQRRPGSMSTLTASGNTANSPFVNWFSGEVYGWVSHLGW